MNFPIRSSLKSATVVPIRASTATLNAAVQPRSARPFTDEATLQAAFASTESGAVGPDGNLAGSRNGALDSRLRLDIEAAYHGAKDELAAKRPWGPTA